MKCSKCGDKIPSQSRFCLSCGEPVSLGNAETPTPVVLPKKRLGIWGGLVGLCAVGLLVGLAFWIRGNRVMQAPETPNPQQTPVLKTPALPNSPQANILQTDVEKPPLDLKKPEKPKPPADVVAYLEHLKKVEQARMALQEREIKALSTLLAQVWAEPLKKMLDLTNPDIPDTGDESASLGEMKKTFANLTQEWQRLSAYFLSVRPPQDCQALADKYYDALREVIIHVGKVQNYMLSQDMNLMNMRGKSGSVDQKLIAADEELSRVCGQFGIEKTFRIQADMAQAPILGL